MLGVGPSGCSSCSLGAAAEQCHGRRPTGLGPGTILVNNLLAGPSQAAAPQRHLHLKVVAVWVRHRGAVGPAGANQEHNQAAHTRMMPRGTSEGLVQAAGMHEAESCGQRITFFLGPRLASCSMLAVVGARRLGAGASAPCPPCRPRVPCLMV